MWIFNVFTLFVALSALVLTLVQFVTRHRPFVGISDANALVLTNPPGITITLKNWGEVAAENISVEVQMMTLDQEPGNVSYHEAHSEYIDIIFPTQEAPLMILISPDEVINLNNKRGASAKVTVSYESRPHFKLETWTYGRFSHDQYIVIDQSSFRVLSNRTILDFLHSSSS